MDPILWIGIAVALVAGAGGVLWIALAGGRRAKRTDEKRGD